MLADDGELQDRQRLLRTQLPRRFARLLHNGRQLAGSTDIHFLALLGEDARFLAQSLRSGPDTALVDALIELDHAIAPVLASQEPATPAVASRIAACIDALEPLAPIETAEPATPQTTDGASPAKPTAAAGESELEFPLTPEQWQRFVQGSSAEPPAPTMPTPAAPATVEIAAPPVQPVPPPQAPAIVPVPATSSAFDLADRLRSAIDGHGLSLAFQPMMSLQSGGTGQYQALLRLRDANGDIHGAADLIPAAECAGLLAAVDRWVLEHCIATIAQQVASRRPVRLFATQSLSSARNAWAATRIQRLLVDHGVAPQAISLELQVEEAIAAPNDVARYADAVRALGCGFVLSGFEDGPAAEYLLATLRFDAVRLSPRCLALADARARVELKVLVERLHEQGRRVIAPRVDTAGVAAALYAAGVDYVQGNFVQPVDGGLGFDFDAAP